jgi:hypothetical protein
VNGHDITHSFWMETVLLDQVLSGLAGQRAPTPSETLDRLINEQLILQATPSEPEPTAEEIEAQIAALEQNWAVGDAAVVTALENAGLARSALERTVGRLLRVQAGLANLESQDYDPESWLEEQRASAHIQIIESAASIAGLPAQSPLPTEPTSPLPAPTTVEQVAPPPTSIPPATEPPPALAIPEFGPDFTLEQAGGGTFTLSEQLAKGPVVLTFFQRCG